MIGFLKFREQYTPEQWAARETLESLIREHDANALPTQRPSGPVIPTDAIFDAYDDDADITWASLTSQYDLPEDTPFTERPVRDEFTTVIDPSITTASQPTVNATTLLRALKKPVKEWQEDMPLVVKTGTTHLVLDGHHRLAAAILMDLKVVPVQLLSVDTK